MALLVEGIGGDVMSACLDLGIELIPIAPDTIRMKGTKQAAMDAMAPFVEKHSGFIHRALTVFGEVARPISFREFH